MPFISEAGLNQLKIYQYKSGGYSTLDNYFNPFWELIPKSLAPNLITLIGFVNMIIGTFIQVYYSPSMTQDIPAWALYNMGFSIFVYQTLDAIDGKQARRTKSSSPLGQLFDHGCDSCILIFFIITASISQKMDINTVIFQLVVFQLFYLSITQQEHHTGILHINNIGSSEIELVAILNQIVAAGIGQESFHSQLNYISGLFFSKYNAIIYTIAIHLSRIWDVGFIYVFYGIFTKAQSKIKVLLEWLPFVILWCLQILCFNIVQTKCIPSLSSMNLYQTTSFSDPKLTITIDKYLIFKIIVVNMTFTTMELSTAMITLIPMEIQSQKYIFWACFICSIVQAFIFLRGVVIQITNYLGIKCFTIKSIQ